MCNYTNHLIEYLVRCGYDSKLLKPIGIKSRGLSFFGVKVLDKQGQNAKVIQAFALMSDSERTSHRLFPFYRTHNWGKNNGNVYPSCSIATLNKDETWTIYDAHDSSRKRDDDYIDYDKALERFRSRLDAEPVRAIGKNTQYTCWGMALLMIAYFVLVQVCPGLSLSFDGNVITFFVLIVVLVLLPLLIPFIEGISLYGFDLLFRKNQ